LLAAVTLAVWATLTQRDDAGAALRRLGPAPVALAAAAAVGTVACTGMLWRAVLADLGDRLPVRTAATIFLLGQLGKYLPGSLWPVLMQTELGSRHGVSRRRTAATSLATLLVSLTSGLLIVVVTLPFLPRVPGNLRWFALAAVPLAGSLHPAVLGRVIDAGLRLARAEPLRARTTPAGTAVAIAWAVASWVCSGLQVLALAVPLGMPLTARSLLLAIGGFALGWSVGFLVLVAPAGAGAREATLVAVLGSALPTGGALVVALLSRLLFTVADLVLAGLAALAAFAATRSAAGRGPL